MSSFPSVRFPLFATLAFACAAASVGRAVILAGATAVHPGAPADDPGWNNVVSVNGSSGVYLGNGWMLTASHVGAGGVTIGATPYAVQPGSAVRLREASGTGWTDLLLFRLTGLPALPAVALPSAVVAEDTPVVMIGFGRQRGAAVSYDSAWNLGGTPVAYSGFQWAGNVKGWGTNLVAGTTVVDYGYGNVTGYVTDFTLGAGATADEAQAAVNDSGGAVFAKVGGQWKLAGIMVCIATHDGQPGDVAIYGDLTFSVELAEQRTAIETLRALATPYAIWDFDQFRGASAGASADPDNDGLTNLQEFVFGTDPHVADRAAGPGVTLENYGDGAALTATWVQNTAATDTTCTVEVSSDLVNWSSGDSATETLSVSGAGTDRERHVVRDRTTTAAGARRFLRLVVNRP